MNILKSFGKVKIITADIFSYVEQIPSTRASKTLQSKDYQNGRIERDTKWNMTAMT